jgi:hypothetical protein
MREHQPRDRSRIGVLGYGFLEPGEPTSVHNHVIVEEGDEVPGRAGEGTIACEIETRKRFADILDIRQRPHDILRRSVRGVIVYDDQLEVPWVL